MYLKQVQNPQRSNVGTIYITWSFNRGAMKAVIFWICSLTWIIAICSLTELTYKLENHYIVVLSLTAIIIVSAAPVVYFYFKLFGNEDRNKYDPYDIADMD